MELVHKKVFEVLVVTLVVPVDALVVQRPVLERDEAALKQQAAVPSILCLR